MASFRANPGCVAATAVEHSAGRLAFQCDFAKEFAPPPPRPTRDETVSVVHVVPATTQRLGCVPASSLSALLWENTAERAEVQGHRRKQATLWPLTRLEKPTVFGARSSLVTNFQEERTRACLSRVKKRCC